MQHKEIYELLAILTDCERNNLVLIIKSNRAKMLNDLVNKEYRNANNKIQIHSELQLCL